MLKKIITLTLLLLSNYAFSQKSITDSIISIPFVETSVSIQRPGGDMADRFGDNAAINFGFHYKTKKNFTFGFQLQNLTGGNIKNSDNIFGDISTIYGPITSDGQIAEINLFERGMNTSFQFGKVFNVVASNPNSGIWIQLGAGYAWNKIKIIDNGSQIVQFTDDFLKGYDQLTEGFLINQSIGYLYLSNKKLLNFSVAFEVMEAFTSNVRKYSYIDKKEINNSNLDILYGIKFSWILPLYRKSDNSYHYY